MFKQQRITFNTPITIQNVLTSEARTYLMSHLLAAGFKGTEYQLLVLMEKLTTLLVNQQAFEAVVEIEGFGNLDDIGIVLKTDGNPTDVASYQVKYYNHPLSIYDFFNQDKKDTETENNKQTKANEKMHIGKFFSGWLAWRKKYPNIDKQKIQSIIYTNASIDRILNKCIQNGVFTDEFISHEKVIWLRKNPNITPAVTKNFLTKIGVTEHYSKKIWFLLQGSGFLDDNGALTKKFEPNKADFTLSLSENDLPENVTERKVISQLKIIHNAYEENLVDLLELLYEQAFDYLEKNKIFNALTKQSKTEKKALFSDFLKSFQFQCQQSHLLECEATILENLAKLSSTSTDQVFLCLYYAIREWFRSEEHKGNVPILTDSIMKSLIASAILRGEKLFLLQGRSEATFSHMLCAYDGRSVIRDEAIELEDCFEDAGFQLVVGEKGLGKSGLIKQVLSQPKFHSSQYLVLAAADLTQDAKLRKNLIEVLKNVATIHIIVIDDAEALLELSSNFLDDFITQLRQLNRCVVFTLPPEAAKNPVFKKPITTIHLKPLSVSAVLTTFPELMPYQRIKRLMHLAQIPFHLNYILRLIKQMDKQQFNDLVTSRNNKLEYDIVKLVIEGAVEEGFLITRRLQWTALALKIAQTPNGLAYGISDIHITQGLQLLIDDGIVISETKNNTIFYRFSHDLLFEYALLTFFMRRWEDACLKNKTPAFWEKINPYLQTSGAIAALEKWLLIYWSSLKNDLVASITIIAKQPYVKTIITIAIMTKQNDILAKLLNEKNIDLNIVFKHDMNFQATYLLIAIWYDNPEAIALLIKHGANRHHSNAGTLLLNLYHASYDTQSDDELFIEHDSEESESENNLDFCNDDLYFNEDDESEDLQKFFVEENDFTDEAMETIDNFVRQLRKYWLGSEEISVEYDQDIDDCLFNHAAPVIQLNYDNSYIHQAVIHERPDCLSALMIIYDENSEKQVINLQSTYQETPLHIAVLNRAYASMRLLISKGALIDLQDFWGETALHNAAYNGDLTAARALLICDADPNCVNKNGLTPYHIAIARLDIKMVKLLFSYGADLSLRPFAELTQGITVAELLQKVYENCQDQDAQNHLEDFVIKLIELLNYGWDDNDLTWGNCCPQIDDEIRAEQCLEVEDLMTLVEHRAKLSDFVPDFDYWDDESQLEYAINTGDMDLIDELRAYILNAPESIEQVLESEAFQDLKQELLEEWLADASVEQYRNVKAYAEASQDEELLVRIQKYLSYLDEETQHIDLPLRQPLRASSVSMLSQSQSGFFESKHLKAKKEAEETDETDNKTHYASRKNKK
jgi:hypothetical protein